LKVRILLLSDIHSNLAAFEAVLNDAGLYDEIWCLGDVIGYGPQPNECIERLECLAHICVAGNHDWAAVGKLNISAFNPYALQACVWTGKQLKPRNRQFIECLPEKLVEGQFTIVHGSPRQPIWEYITDPWVAAANFSHFDTLYCLVGHTHKPVIYRYNEADGSCEELPLPALGEQMSIAESRLLINPGGVGQPRDGDPRASYVLLDLEQKTVEFRRVEYPIEDTQRLMLDVGLPQPLARRLSFGW
jgi:predicted phosphodiesterase